MFTKPDAHAEHGGHPTGWLAVLGTALGLLLTTGCIGETGRVAGPGPAAEPAGAHGNARLLPPFVVAPAVQIEDVDEPRQPRRAKAAGPPARLVVPELGVDAPVVDIGVTDGVLVPPDDPQVLGWWKDGAVAGAARGGALITGHTVHSGGGAFDDLETLQPGDRLSVRTSKGRIRYAVQSVTVYWKATLAQDAQRVFRQSGPGRLVLITCEDWNGTGYDSNAVVFAEPL